MMKTTLAGRAATPEKKVRQRANVRGAKGGGVCQRRTCSSRRRAAISCRAEAVAASAGSIEGRRAPASPAPPVAPPAGGPPPARSAVAELSSARCFCEPRSWAVCLVEDRHGEGIDGVSRRKQRPVCSRGSLFLLELLHHGNLRHLGESSLPAT